MFDVCVVVVNHGHHSAYLFGDSSHQRIYLYQKIEATHYDALLPDPTCDICSEADEDEAIGERHCASSPPPPPLLYIDAWADGVATPVLTESTDDADAEVQLMKLLLPYSTESVDEGSSVPELSWTEKTFRRWVGRVYGVRLQRNLPVEGQTTHFFEAVSNALGPTYPLRLETDIALRRRTIEWLMDCNDGLNGNIGRGCRVSIVRGCGRHYNRTYISHSSQPFKNNLLEYLQNTADAPWGEYGI